MKFNENSIYHGFILYEAIDMSNWCKKKTILNLIEQSGHKMNERIFRGIVAYNNILFAEGQRDFYIAHSNQFGYIATKDKAIIKSSIADLRARALDMLWKVSSTEKRLQEEGYDPLL